MRPMYLPEVETHVPLNGRGERIRQMRAAGVAVPQIFHLFAFKPEFSGHLERFTQGVMRGPSPLSPGQRELIAAYTSRRDHCLF